MAYLDELINRVFGIVSSLNANLFRMHVEPKRRLCGGKQTGAREIFGSGGIGRARFAIRKARREVGTVLIRSAGGWSRGIRMVVRSGIWEVNRYATDGFECA
jgi:hypothetical protein